MVNGVYSWQKRAIVFAVSLFIFPGLSHAGFEWHPPAASEKPDIPVVRALPVPGVNQEPAGPIIDPNPMQSYGGSAGLMPVPVEGQVIGGTGMDMAAQPDSFSISEGFGRDLPLALAMRQIVPLEYAYSFDEEVDPSLRVSWDGGKPWNIILKDAVSPYGFDVVIADKTAWVLPASKVDEHKRSGQNSVAVLPPDRSSGVAAIKEEVPGSFEASVAAEPLMPLEINAMPEENTSSYGNADLERIGMNDAQYTPSYPRRTPPAKQVAAEPEMASAPTSLLPMDSTPATAGPFVLSDMDHWQANAGEGLNDVLATWSDKAGVRLLWQVSQDYKLPSTIQIRGTYPEAVTELLAAYSDARPQPQGKLYPNLPHGPSVLVVGPAAHFATQ